MLNCYRWPKKSLHTSRVTSSVEHCGTHRIRQHSTIVSLLVPCLTVHQRSDVSIVLPKVRELCHETLIKGLSVDGTAVDCLCVSTFKASHHYTTVTKMKQTYRFNRIYVDPMGSTSCKNLTKKPITILHHCIIIYSKILRHHKNWHCTEWWNRKPNSLLEGHAWACCHRLSACCSAASKALTARP